MRAPRRRLVRVVMLLVGVAVFAGACGYWSWGPLRDSQMRNALALRPQRPTDLWDLAGGRHRFSSIEPEKGGERFRCDLESDYANIKWYAKPHSLDRVTGTRVSVVTNWWPYGFWTGDDKEYVLLCDYDNAIVGWYVYP